MGELALLLLLPQDSYRRAPRAHLTDGLIAATTNSFNTPGPGAITHSRMSPSLPPHMAVAVTVQSPRRSRLCHGQARTSQITQPTGGRGSEQGFLPPGPGPGHHR